MNTPDDQVQPGENFDLRDTENLLTATLDRHATEAPADHTRCPRSTAASTAVAPGARLAP